MTREEAIDMLVKDKEQRGDCFISEALDMAIKALEQEPILDKIRAEIEVMDSNITEHGWRLIRKYDALQIIDKYKAESEDKE